MRKKIIRAFLVVILVFGISGCSTIKTSEDSISKPSSPTSSSQLTVINSSNETRQDEPSNNLSKLSSVQEAQDVQAVQAVPILYYHSVMQENGNELRMPPEQFEAQMAFLQEQGYQSVSLEKLYQALYSGGTLPAKPFVISFDDGYLDNYTTAFPILTKHGFTATVFMVTSYINGDEFMSWHQLKELVANGWEIEGHTTNHPYLTKIDSSTVLSELKTSKEQLEKELGHSVDFFAYPYGDLNPTVLKALKDTGYLMAVTTERGWADAKIDAWHVHRVYCYASMGMNEFSRRMLNPNY
ncbi:MAG: xylanase [Desulfosporosinus sp. BRH_c37]|nr:MAG: xylanase [Desulfosporosinus sp. BRH_c37]